MRIYNMAGKELQGEVVVLDSSVHGSYIRTHGQKSYSLDPTLRCKEFFVRHIGDEIMVTFEETDDKLTVVYEKK